MEANESPQPDLLFIMALQGKVISRIIADAAEFCLADFLIDGPMGIGELAQKTGTNEDALYRVMRALCAVGVFKECGDGTFENNEASAALISGVEGSMRDILRWLNCKHFWDSCSHLDYSLKTGKSTFEKVYGTLPFDYLRDNENIAALFSAAADSSTPITGDLVAEACDFSGCKKIVDIGGGNGSLLKPIIARNSHLAGVVFDRPEVVQGAGKNLGEFSGKIDFKAGDFFAGVPGDADVYIMKNVIHDWDDEHCIKLLGNCRAAMSPGGRVMIVEQVITPGPESVLAKLMDIEMLMIYGGGRERTEAEFKTLLDGAGLKLSRVLPTRSPLYIIEAVKP